MSRRLAFTMSVIVIFDVVTTLIGRLDIDEAFLLTIRVIALFASGILRRYDCLQFAGCCCV